MRTPIPNELAEEHRKQDAAAFLSYSWPVTQSSYYGAHMRQRLNGGLYRKGLCWVAAVLLMAGCRQSISGSYLASDQNTVCRLQLVRTPDNHLTGQLAASTMKPDGTVAQSNVSVTGAVDGENVTLSGAGFLGLQSFVLAGTLKGNTLTLTGAQSVPVIFKRGTLRDYQQQIAGLNARSQGIVKARAAAQAQQRNSEAQEEFVEEIDRLIARMAQFDSEADVHLGRFPDTERGYEAITERIAAIVARERQLAGNQNASVTRAQLSVAANQASIQTEQMHNQAVSLESALNGNIRPMAEQATRIEQQCHGVASNNAPFTTAEIQSINAACGRLESADGHFRQRYRATSDGLAHLEQVYQRERTRQQALIQESERLE